MDSPALSVISDFSDMSDEELDKYFANYVPLSNLPTPPPAKEQPVVAVTAPPESEDDRQAPELEVHATHLANLVPRNVSTRKPVVSVIRGYLERACLPTEIVAFAACVLDALSERFAISWRDACCPSSSSSNFYAKTHLRQQPAASPDLIVLSALALAHGFVDDRGRTNSHWARVEGKSQFTAREIELTKMCILRDMDYGLSRIKEDMVRQMMRDMQRAGNFTTSPVSIARRDSGTAEKEERRPKLALGTGTPGTAIWSNGVQTPEPSP